MNFQSEIAGITNITSFLMSPAFVCLSNYTGLSADLDVTKAMPIWESTAPPKANTTSAASITVDSMSGRPIETGLNFMTSYQLRNDKLFYYPYVKSIFG